MCPNTLLSVIILVIIFKRLYATKITKLLVNSVVNRSLTMPF